MNASFDAPRLFVSRSAAALRFSHVILSPPAAAAALRRALISEGFGDWSAAEIELFCAGGETLVLARARPKDASAAHSTG